MDGSEVFENDAHAKVICCLISAEKWSRAGMFVTDNRAAHEWAASKKGNES